MPQERHQKTLRLSRHYFSGAGAAQADAPGVACDDRTDFEQA
jgi:hypothetical protein